MTETSNQEFFEQHGYYPTTFVAQTFSASKSLSRSTQKTPNAFRASLALRGWRRPLHWTVPPAFEHAGRAYESLGHEAYCQQVREYYESIRDGNVSQAQLEHVRWAIRACLRTFETHVRGFRAQAVGRNGSLFSTASDVLVLPEVLMADGRLVADLKGYLRAYAVPVEQWPAAERLVKLRLSRIWGVKCL